MISECFDLAFRLFSGAMIGLIVGSFSTVLLWRIPRRQSIVLPPSHCPVCKTRLTPRDLIPLVSWMLSAGKCRHCQTPMSITYPLSETMMMILSMVAWGVLGWTWSLVLILIVTPCAIGFVAWCLRDRV